MGRKLDECLNAINEVVLGKEPQVRLAMTCLLGGGHLLIEDLPGMGKTTLSHTLAKVLGLSFQRIQFTSDLLPGDILGTSVFDRYRAVHLSPGADFCRAGVGRRDQPRHPQKPERLA